MSLDYCTSGTLVFRGVGAAPGLETNVTDSSEPWQQLSVRLTIIHGCTFADWHWYLPTWLDGANMRWVVDEPVLAASQLEQAKVSKPPN